MLTKTNAGEDVEQQHFSVLLYNPAVTLLGVYPHESET